jgi:hypothetical protein
MNHRRRPLPVIASASEAIHSVARRLGARRDGKVDLSGKINERWVTSRDRWKGRSAEIEPRYDSH